METIKLFSSCRLAHLGGSRAPDKDRFLTSIMPISSPNPMFDHMLESSHRDDSNKWSNIGFGEEITKIESIEVNFTCLIWWPARLEGCCWSHLIRVCTI